VNDQRAFRRIFDEFVHVPRFRKQLAIVRRTVGTLLMVATGWNRRIIVEFGMISIDGYLVATVDWVVENLLDGRLMTKRNVPSRSQNRKMRIKCGFGHFR
jgi:hypothetical protein